MSDTAEQAAADRKIAPENPEAETFVDEPKPSARQRLRAFEDEVLGEKAVRISGNVERGSGSHFQTKMTDEQRAHHAALERLLEAEQKLADASAVLAKAEADHHAAELVVERGEEAADASDQRPE